MSNDPRKEETESSRSDPAYKVQPSHVPGTSKGEEQALSSTEEGRERGRKNYQDMRDSTGINAEARQPIHPDMPNIPPA